ncbi:hypothetical protein GCM10007415_00930 [Parapedobacter pyrenivorans]|uniref:Neutral/alkaline non-lysosomal ceramidase, N-terminal n=1 Tax=Parapedobacter pyrenivorans TaxID=1305674 RepID=A0A917HBG9_9SPHI|nr:hypothetical protein [Parapedobacter pyrenivorans]GGG73365.1 hypothetical protein GCM10007415_00930 [Parapedobacter pyrenivorans]
MQNHRFKAGAAQIDITPPLGTVINGEFTSRYATKVADPLYAKALVLQAGACSLVIVMVDICAMQRDFLEDVKRVIAREVGIPRQCQLIASTHTHSAGSVTDLLMGHVDWAYRQRLPALIVQGVKAAYSSLRPARIGWGSVDQPQHLMCRRYRMEAEYQAVNPVTGERDIVKTNPFGDEHYIEGPMSVPDPNLRYLAVQNMDGQWISLLANYSLHYVGDCDRSTISADYFGSFARSLSTKLGVGCDFVGMMSNGTSGEINIWDFRDPDRYPKDNHKKSQLIGEDLASAVIGSLPSVEWELHPKLTVVYADVPIGVRKPSEDELTRAKQLVSETDYEDIEFGEPRFFEQVYAREQVLLAEFPDERSFPVQSFQIGSGVIGALGGEFFAETGLKLKAAWPNKKYFTICLANEYVGYVPPAHELKKGGYECWRCRTSHLEVDAEATIIQQLTKQLRSYGQLV